MWWLWGFDVYWLVLFEWFLSQFCAISRSSIMHVPFHSTSEIVLLAMDPVRMFIVSCSSSAQWRSHNHQSPCSIFFDIWIVLQAFYLHMRICDHDSYPVYFSLSSILFPFFFFECNPRIHSSTTVGMKAY